MTAPRCAWIVSLHGCSADLDDPVGEIDRRGTVGNHQHETADTELPYRSERALLCRRIKMRSRLVQQEEIRSAFSAQEATGERDALTLSSGEVRTVLRDPPTRVDVSQAAFAKAAATSYPWHRLPRSNVSCDCAGYQRGPLRHPGYVAEPALAVGFGYRHAVHP